MLSIRQLSGSCLLLALGCSGCEPAKTTPEAEKTESWAAQGDVLTYAGHAFPRSLSFEAQGSRYRAELDRSGTVTVHVQSLRKMSECAQVQPGLLPDSCKCWAGFELLDRDADGQPERCAASFNTTCLSRDTDRLMFWQDLGLCREKTQRLKEVVPIISKAHLASEPPRAADAGASKGLDLGALCERIESDGLLQTWRTASLKEQLKSEAEATRQEALKGETTQIPEDILSRIESVTGCTAQASFSANMTDQKGELLHRLQCQLTYEFSPLTSEWTQTEESACVEERSGKVEQAAPANQASREPAQPASGNKGNPSLKSKAKNRFDEAKSSVKRFFRSW